MLKDVFGGNCRATLILTASPSSYNISETINTIRFGKRAKRVLNTAKPNIDKSIFEHKRLIQHLKENETKNSKLFKLIMNEKEIKSVLSTNQPKLLEDIETVITEAEKTKKAEEKKAKKESTSSSRSRRHKQAQDDSRDDSTTITQMPEERLAAELSEI